METTIYFRRSLSPPLCLKEEPSTSTKNRNATDIDGPLLSTLHGVLDSTELHDGIFSVEASGQLPAAEEEEEETEMELQEQMELEKQLFPGANEWADDETTLFEALFLRSRLSLLPLHWEFDFRGIPVSQTVFQTHDETHQPLIYPHSEHEFRASVALMRLVDLTPNVRATCQSDCKSKAPRIIKKALDRFLRWTAEDGGYAGLQAVPNIMTEIIDTKGQTQDVITGYLQNRMNALARLQRDFLRTDRDANFWQDVEPRVMDPDTSLYPLLLDKATGACQSLMTVDISSNIDELVPTGFVTPTQAQFGPMKRKTAHEDSEASDDELGQDGDETRHKRRKTESSNGTSASIKDTDNSAPLGHILDGTAPRINVCCKGEDSDLEYVRTPPVVYGLFILNAAVFVLTVDSAKGPDAYVSFHVEIDFSNHQQSIWNALTLAMTACLARDELMSRMEDFAPREAVEESDPDL